LLSLDHAIGKRQRTNENANLEEHERNVSHEKKRLAGECIEWRTSDEDASERGPTCCPVIDGQVGRDGPVWGRGDGDVPGIFSFTGMWG
jgi:hypothetical protein